MHFIPFRMTRTTFKKLEDYVTKHIEMKGQGGTEPMTIQETCLITVWYLATQCYLRELSSLFARSVTAVWQAITRVCNILAFICVKDFIRWPGPSEVGDIALSFESSVKSGLPVPGIIGAIDGCHIKIKAPGSDQISYLNRRMFHSIIIIAVSLPNKLFSYVSVGFPGSAHDSRVFCNSSLWFGVETSKNAYFTNSNYQVIGDSTFPCLSWLIPVLKDSVAVTSKEKAFNKQMSKSRVVIENPFGDLKNRFRRTQFVNTSVERASVIVTASCELHNICISNGDGMNTTFVDPSGGLDLHIPVAPLTSAQESNEGKAKRRRLIDMF